MSLRTTDPCVVGIDLGTTYSLVAVVEHGRPRVLLNALGEVLTPSVVSVDGDETLVGAAARARQVTHPRATASGFKRDMGTGAHYELGVHRLTPPALSALVLKNLREDAEAVLGRRIDEAVVTVPAYFDDAQRRATHEAAQLADLHVERLLNEPTAAAIAYGLHHLDRELKAVVLDLGGGTFDVTIPEILEGVIEIQSTAGDTRLGGDDFTLALAQLVAGQIEASWSTGWDLQSASGRRLFEALERSKKELTREPMTHVSLPRFERFGGGLVDVVLDIDRQQAETCWQPLLERIRGPIFRALRDAGLAVRDIDEVLLVGGSTRMPVFRALAKQIFDQEPLHHLPVDEAVALGAALQAALKVGDAALEDLVVTDVAPFTLGIDTIAFYGNQTMKGLFTPILERGTVLPNSRVKQFSTVYARQTQVNISVYQGEHPRCEKNRFLGELRVDGIPATEETQPLDVRFTYDLNGILDVDVEILSTGERRNLVLEQSPGRLSTEELESARQIMTRLKFHPREALPNTTALARAEELYTELIGARREELGSLIVEFHSVLETQDPQRIEMDRTHLLAWIRAVRSADG